MSELERKVRLLREVQHIAEEAQAEIEALRDDIKALMGDTEEVWAGGHKVTYKPVTSCRLDTAALKQALPELAEKFTTVSTVRRLCVS